MENSVFIDSIALHVAWVLLPLIPAVLIYLLFPSTTVTASGVLAGLTVRAGGAFAGYLVIFLLTYPLVERTENTIGGFLHTSWKVSGEIKLIDSRSKEELHSEALLSKLVIETKPEIIGTKSFLLKASMPEEDRDFPWIVLNIPKFGEAVINIRDQVRETNDYEKKIHLSNPIVITGDPSITDVPVNAAK